MIRPHQSLCLFAILGGAALGACVANDADAPMRILANNAPGEGCSVDPGSGLFLDDGIIDTQASNGYIFTPAVENSITLIEGEATGPKTIYIEGARVEIAFYDTVSFPAANFDDTLLRFATPSSGSIEPGGGTAGFSFEIVPRELLVAMQPILLASASGRTTLDVRIQMFGTKGGGDVKSQTFRYPVQVCVGCLVRDVGACTSLSDSFIPLEGGACQRLQDGVLECCNDFTVCPARAPEGT